MGLSSDDQKPDNITLHDAYESVRDWYRTNKAKCRASDQNYVKKSFDLIDRLPPASNISELEIRAVLGEVIYGNLEWGYHESDGDFKMAAYAEAALEQAGFEFWINEQDKQSLKASSLWPHLSINRSS